MEHRQVGVGAFLPAGEDAAKTVQPGVGAFDDPAAGAEAGLTLDQLRFLSARADVGGKAELMAELSHLVVVIAAIETQALTPARCRRWPLDRDRLERGPDELEVVQVRARWRDPDRDALALGEERSLRPFFALSVGLGPVSSPPSAAFPSAPSIANHSHSIPCLSS